MSNTQTTESSSQALVAQDGLGGYDWSNDFDSEVQKCSKCLESFKCLQKNYDTEREKHNKAKLEIRGYEIALESLEARILGHEKNELAWGDELKLKIEKWEGSSKNLTKILNSQMSTHDKNGLGFGTQMDDLRLDEYAFRNKIIESKTTETNKTICTTNEATIVKPKSVNETVVSKPKINRDEVIIKDLTSDDEDDVCADKTVSSVKPKVNQAVRSQADKSGQTSQKQGIDHLIKDCDFYDQKNPKPRVKNVVNTGKREVKPVWDYGERVNH
ncbi:hypothetical protein Tco_1143553 [Tanacetum coccineum]